MIYLDNAATTPCAPEVVEAMLPFLNVEFGNASSIDHAMGSRARAAVEVARDLVAQLVAAKPEEVIFTSGSTEANNLVLNCDLPIITSSVEHPSVLDATKNRRSFDNCRIVQVDNVGKALTDSLESALDVLPQPAIVSIMTVNNEIGTQNDIPRIVSIAKSRGAFVHSDATQCVALGYPKMDSLQIDALSISAHKMYGPKGIGALICRADLRRRVKPLCFGGGHERGLRSGTLNVPAIVGFGVAAKQALNKGEERIRRFAELRSKFLAAVAASFKGEITINGGECSPHICSLRLVGINNRALLKATSSKVCYSLGSACATAKNEPSHVLLALGQTKVEANETIRVSFGADQSVEEVMRAAAEIATAANQLSQLVA